MKILLIDTETSPNTVYTWGLWDQNIGLNQIIETSELLCYAAKWYEDSVVDYSSKYSHGSKDMLGKLWQLLDESDVVVHYNGAKFDIPVINREFLKHGLLPPSPYKQIDLLKVARKQFKFASNKLDYVSQYLDLGKKDKTDFTLWIKCMKDDPRAWEKMEKYNKQDVVLLEKLYVKLLPWITTHPNVGAFQEDKAVCPNCGGIDYQKRGLATAALMQYQRYRCNDCGTWFRSTTSVTEKSERFVGAK